MKRRIFRHAARFVIIAVIAIAAFSGAVMLLWNALLPEIFGVHAITFPQALGLLLLARILFGTLRGRGGRGRWRRGHREWHGWHHLTPEERERFKAGMRRRFHHDDRCRERDGRHEA